MWDKIKYTVPTPGGPRLLLDEVGGWIKPGQMTALMGASGKDSANNRNSNSNSNSDLVDRVAKFTTRLFFCFWPTFGFFLWPKYRKIWPILSRYPVRKIL